MHIHTGKCKESLRNPVSKEKLSLKTFFGLYYRILGQIIFPLYIISISAYTITFLFLPF